MATTEQRIAALLENHRRTNREVYGLPVRCPTCNAGIGKFCLKDMSKPHRTADDIAIHPARVALANA